MQVIDIETFIVNIPYDRREESSMVSRDGVTDIIIKVTTDNGIVGWGEAASGADVASVELAIHAMKPFVIGRSPWNAEAMQAELFHHGLWAFRAMTGNFAWAGIDMALWDIRGKAANQPLYRLFGGLRQSQMSYFYYLARGDEDDLRRQVAEGTQRGYQDFYLKVGLDFDDDFEMVAIVRDALGTMPRLRLDANAIWSPDEALRNMQKLAQFDIDFLEQPVREHPLDNMRDIRQRAPMAIAANEGLWTEAEAFARISAKVADVFCFSPYWVGSMAAFHRLSYVAHWQGLRVCKHTHGEFGLAAVANHHLLLTLPNVVTGHQQTAQHMTDSLLTVPIPIKDSPIWGIPEGVGLCVEVDEAALSEAAERYRQQGQYLPYQDHMLGKEER